MVGKQRAQRIPHSNRDDYLNHPHWLVEVVKFSPSFRTVKRVLQWETSVFRIPNHLLKRIGVLLESRQDLNLNRRKSQGTNDLAKGE
jgi:hypothetical protein